MLDLFTYQRCSVVMAKTAVQVYSSPFFRQGKDQQCMYNCMDSPSEDAEHVALYSCGPAS